MIVKQCTQPPNVSNHFILYILLMILNQMGKITKNNIFRCFVLYIYIYIYKTVKPFKIYMCKR